MFSSFMMAQMATLLLHSLLPGEWLSSRAGMPVSHGTTIVLEFFCNRRLWSPAPDSVVLSSA